MRMYPAGGRPVSDRKLKRGTAYLLIQEKAARRRPFLYEAGKLTTSRRYNRRTFAAVKPWRVRRELAV